MTWILVTIGCILSSTENYCSSRVAPQFFATHAICKEVMDATMNALPNQGIDFRFTYSACIDTGADT